jgi:D-methionine transport system ATP-binding protein
VEVLGHGSAADVPVNAVIKDRFGLDVRVLAGSVEDLAGERFAHHLLALPDGAAHGSEGVDDVVSFLQQNGYRAAQRTRTQVETAQGTAQDLGGAQ